MLGFMAFCSLDNLFTTLWTLIWYCLCVCNSERADPHYCRDRLTEGSNINKSLVTLGIVISALGKSKIIILIWTVAIDRNRCVYYYIITICTLVIMTFCSNLNFCNWLNLKSWLSSPSVHWLFLHALHKVHGMTLLYLFHLWLPPCFTLSPLLLPLFVT